MKLEAMNHKKKKFDDKDTMRPEYDLDYSKAIRGKHAKRIREEGTNIVLLEPDVAEEFRDSASVNEALRSLLQIANTTRRLTSQSGKRTVKTS